MLKRNLEKNPVGKLGNMIRNMKGSKELTKEAGLLAREKYAA